MPREEARLTASQKSFEYTLTYPFSNQQNRRILFSTKEIMHLAAAALLAVCAGLSLFLFSNRFSVNYVLVVVFAGIFAVSFLAHEMAHKMVAQRQGLWAEFRLSLTGAALTLLSMAVPYPKIISPGQVIVAGSVDHRTMGKISVAGPITNILFASLFMLGAVFLPSHRVFLTYLVVFNSWIAVFNLIPFGVFDGFKIFNWSRKVWALVFTASAVLLTISIWPFW
jgi:Zn-dependent protease